MWIHYRINLNQLHGLNFCQVMTVRFFFRVREYSWVVYWCSLVVEGKGITIFMEKKKLWIVMIWKERIDSNLYKYLNALSSAHHPCARCLQHLFVLRLDHHFHGTYVLPLMKGLGRRCTSTPLTTPLTQDVTLGSLESICRYAPIAAWPHYGRVGACTGIYKK